MFSSRLVRVSALGGWLFAGVLSLALQSAHGETLDELHQKALKESGTLNFYATLAQLNAAKIIPVFEKRFPGIKVNHVDATADQLAARAITEARGGRVLGDVFAAALENTLQVADQGLLLELDIPEKAAYPDNLKGNFWVANDLIFITQGWNTNLVKPDEAPKSIDDLADPKWKNKIIGEPRDVELFIGLMQKHGSEEKALEIVKRMAANNVEFHKGHSQLAELLVAGQAPVCLTCYSHHFPPRLAKGAPLGYLLSEGVGTISAVAVFKDAPNPNTALLWVRWAASEEGQQAFAEGGRTPAHPNVEPVEQTRPEKIYALSENDYNKFNDYQKIWKQVFGLR